jgi:hypothetical protein
VGRLWAVIPNPDKRCAPITAGEFGGASLLLQKRRTLVRNDSFCHPARQLLAVLQQFPIVAHHQATLRVVFLLVPLYKLVRDEPRALLSRIGKQDS